MTDSLRISALRATTHIGVHDWEQRILQPLLLDICVPIDVSTCDNTLSNTIDYSALCQRITTFVESTTFQLIETVAEKVAQLIKDEWHATEVSVSVSKPHAVKNAGTISVTVKR